MRTINTQLLDRNIDQGIKIEVDSLGEVLIKRVSPESISCSVYHKGLRSVKKRITKEEHESFDDLIARSMWSAIRSVFLLDLGIYKDFSEGGLSMKNPAHLKYLDLIGRIETVSPNKIIIV